MSTRQGCLWALVVQLGAVSLFLAVGRAAAADKPKATLSGHEGGVYSVAFSPDGKTLASGSWDKTVRLWDVATRTLKATLNTHTSYVNSVAFSPDGRLLASASSDKTIKLWDARSGKELATLAGNTGEVNSVAFSPDGATLASGSENPAEGTGQAVRLWDVATRKEKATFKGTHDVRFSPDGKSIAFLNPKYLIAIGDVETGKQRVLARGLGDVSSPVFSPDGRTLAFGGPDKTVRLWDLATGLEQASLPFKEDRGMSFVAFSPDGRTLAAGGGAYGGYLHFWNVATGRRKGRLSPESWSVSSLAFSPDGKTIAVAGTGENADTEVPIMLYAVP